MARGDDDPSTDAPDYQAELWITRFENWRERTRWEQVKLVAGFALWFLRTRHSWSLTMDAFAEWTHFHRVTLPWFKRMLRARARRTLH